MRNKVFIIYHDISKVNHLVDTLNNLDTDINIGNKFTTDQYYQQTEQLPYSYYYINQLEINKALKNNSLLYIITNDYISTGITIDDFYNYDIFCMTYKEYNVISDIIFNKYHILTIWLDSPDKKYKNINYDITFVEHRLENVPYEYFLNDKSEDICKIIINYLET